MTAIPRIDVLADCPKCSGAGGACSYCGLPACDEDEIASHPAEAEWKSCTLCGGEGEVNQIVAGVFTRQQKARAAIAPEPVAALPALDIEF